MTAAVRGGMARSPARSADESGIPAVDQRARRNLAADPAQVMPRPRQAFEQTHGVRMVRPAKKIIDRGGLDVLPDTYRDPIANLIGRAQVVGGEEDSDAAFFREPLEQLENLPAWIVTSSAVVGSSAITSFGCGGNAAQS